MSEPRIGDTVVLKSMRPATVVKVGAKGVTVLAGSVRTSVPLSDLECVDHDDGLWQQMESRRP